MKQKDAEIADLRQEVKILRDLIERSVIDDF